MPLLLLPLIVVVMTATGERQPPNIVIILADDMGWADVGYHNKRVQTPNLDKLAKQGIELDRFYVAPTCTPTRAGLMTGRYPIRFGMAQSALPPYRRFGLPASEVTIAEALADRGYVDRGVFGKWHLGHLEPKWHPLSQGFTHFEGHYNGAINYFKHAFKGEHDWHIDYEPTVREGYSTDLIASAAKQFIEKGAPQKAPYFAYIAFNAPHTPLQAKQEDLDRFIVGDTSATKEIIQAAMIWNLDKAIGGILRAIENSGEADNTIVWFISDNGGAAGIGDNNYPLSGHKRGVFEGGIRVPAIARWPDKWLGGQKITDTMGYIDVFPTLVAQADNGKSDAENPTSALDGIDLGPRFEGTGKPIPERDWYTYLGQDHPTMEWMAIQSGDWKLLVYGPRLDINALGRKHQVALYDIANDPAEKEDLTPEYPRRIGLLAKKLARHRSLQPENSIGPYMSGSNQPFTPPRNWKNSPTGE